MHNSLFAENKFYLPVELNAMLLLFCLGYNTPLMLKSAHVNTGT